MKSFLHSYPFTILLLPILALLCAGGATGNQLFLIIAMVLLALDIVIACWFEGRRRERVRLYHALMKSMDILGDEMNPQKGINRLLASVGHFYDADRSYIFEYGGSRDVINNTFEWSRKGIEPMIGMLQNVPTVQVIGWFKEFERQGAFYMDALDCDKNREDTRKTLEMQGIQWLTAAPILDNGEILGFIGVDNPRKAKRNVQYLRVVTSIIHSEMVRRKENEEKMAALNLASQQRHIKSFGDMVNAALWSMNISTEDKVVEVSWSNEFRRMFGFKENLLDFPNTIEAWSSRLHPEDQERTLEHFWNGIASRNTEEYVYDIEYRIKRKNDEYRWYRAVGRMEELSDGMRRMYGIIYDITTDKRVADQQKQLEEALAMAQSASRAKTTFLNNMSHDIRTPMNAIIGFTGLAASHIDNKELIQDYLGKINQASSHLLSLINDVLDMSRIESGKMHLEEHPEHLPSIIHTLHAIVMGDIQAHQHEFFIDTVNVNDEDVICDKLRLNQVLLNILSNAVKFTPNGGIIAMRITEKTVNKAGYATYEFCIKDNGMGMDPEFQKTIFAPFMRAKSSTVSGIQGTGLGMAITKSIVDMMGGRIEVQSELGKGTQMTVTFDFKLDNDHEEVSPIIPELSDLRGLVVDDDTNTCMSMAAMLRNVGMRGEWCRSGKEAVLRAEEAYRLGDNFKVYIIDWLMPDMNGIETTRRIRKVIGNEVPIIILTAYDWSDIEQEAREAGVTTFIAKPLFPSDLHRALCDCLEKHEEVKKVVEVEYDFQGKKILLVEDNELNLEIATELLKENDFIVDTANDGTVAVEKMKAAKEGDYDLVLMDIQMPIMDGYEATRTIRAMGTPISKIPILAMTANAFAEDRELALKAGMNEHIAKPINIQKLKATLAKYLG